MATTAIVAQRAERRAAGSSRGPLELWHLLSLDAPAVAALWTAFAAAAFHVVLPWTAPLALALAVWILYAADRLSDAHQQLSPLEERHRFHARHRHAFAAAMCVAALALAVLLLSLPQTVRTAWLLLALPLLLYAAAVHWLRLHVPKEWMVGLFFAAATGIPYLLHTTSLSRWIAAALFGLLCWMNCVRIARAELVKQSEMDRVTAWAILHFRGVTTAFAALAAALSIVWPDARAMLLAIAASAMLLRMLDHVEARTTPVRMRALADAALLTPLLLWPFLPHLR